MGGKRKLPMEKIQKKESRAVVCSKRRDGLFSKASDLCLLSGSQMAILATPPPSSQSKTSFFSFGHSSVDGVVSAFLSDQRPVLEDIGCFSARKDDLGLGFWWEDENLAKSENAEELRGAMDSISRMLNHLKENQEDVRNKELKKGKDFVALHGTQELDDQTLNLQSGSASFPVLDDRLKRDSEMFVFDDRNLAIPESFQGNFDGFNNQDLDQLIDLKTISESLFDGAFETTQETNERCSIDDLFNE